MNQFSWFNVPEEVKELLIKAAVSWNNTQESEKYINQALELTDNNIDVLVAAYRYFYYKNNYPMALKTAKNVMQLVSKQTNLPEELVTLKTVILKNPNDEQIRLYLNAYAASGLVLAKLGNIEEAKQICEFIKEIDINKEYLSAEILLDVLTRSPDDDED